MVSAPSSAVENTSALRVLLIEIAAIDRFHRCLSFPFFRGALRDLRVDTHSIRFGLKAAVRLDQQESGIALPDNDLAALIVSAQQFGPSHVLFSHEPAPSVCQAIESLPTRPKLGHVGDPATNPLVSSRRVLFEELEAFLDLPSNESPARGVNPFDSVRPDFHWTAGNEEAASAPALPFLVCGEECTFNQPLRRNPMFADVDTSGCSRAYGCSFCARPAGRSRWKTDPVSLFRRQVNALRESHRPWSGQLMVRAVGESILDNIEAVADILVSLDVAPLALLIDGRTDRIVERRPSLEKALERLSGSLHAIHMSLVGVESFVGEELTLLNKGVDWTQNLDAIQMLFELELAHPTTFAFRQHGGLSLLLFTPWTRPELLSINLAVLRRARIVELCGKVLTSRLRLYPTLPLHARAVRDGLVLSAYEDERLDTARRNFYPDEVPWKFATPVMNAVGRVLVRLPSLADDEDPLVGPLRSLLGNAAGSKTPTSHVAAAEAIVDAAMALPDAAASELVRDAEQRMHAPRASGPRPSRPEQSRKFLPPLLLSFVAGIKPVARLEAKDLAWLADRAELKRYAPVVRERRIGATLEVFIGRNAREVDEAIALTDRPARPGSAAWLESVRRLGELLGYPKCCTEAFVASSPLHRENYMYMYLEARLKAPGEVSALLNPGVEQLVNYVPCSLACEATLHRTNVLLDAFREDRGAGPVDRMLQTCARPWLLFLDEQGAGVELVTDDALPDNLHFNARPLRFKAGQVRGTLPIVTDVSEGDTLVIGEQELSVLRDGRVRASVGGRAFVWWHRARIQHEFLSRLMSLRFGPRRMVVASGAGSLDEQATRLAAYVRALFMSPRARSANLGFVVVDARPAGRGESVVTLGLGDDRVTFTVASKEVHPEGYVCVGPIVAFHTQDQPIDTVAKDRAVRRFVRLLAEAVMRAGHRS